MVRLQSWGFVNVEYSFTAITLWVYELNILQYFGNLRHSLAALNDFAKVLKMIYTELWNCCGPGKSY